MKYVINFLKIATAIFILTFFVRILIISPSKINGRSMEPTLHDTQFILVNKLSYFFITPSRNDVVQFIHPNVPAFVVKRIIGVPGDTISIDNEEISVTDQNGQTHTHPLPANSKIGFRVYDLTLGVNEYFLLGDNPDESTDSRHYGPIHRSKIVGSVIIPARSK